MNYGFTDADVSRRLSSLGLGRPPGLQNTASLGTQPNRQVPSSPLNGSYSSMLSNSSQNMKSSSSKFSPQQSESLMRLASSHSFTKIPNQNNNVSGKPPIVPISARANLQAPLLNESNNNNLTSPDPERRTFSPGNNHDVDESNNSINIIFSPEATTSSKRTVPECTSISFKDDQENNNNNGQDQNLQQDEENTNINSYSTPTPKTSNENNFALLSSINWPNLVEVLNLVVEKLNCQLSLVDTVLVGGGILPQQQEQQQVEENNNNNSSKLKTQKQSSSTPTQIAKKSSWAKTLQQHASETLEMLEYNLRHSSFGIKDISSRLGGQLDQLKNDLAVLFGEARELDDILRKNEAKPTTTKENSKNSNNNNNNNSSSSSIDLWANGYLQRLSVAHDLTQRILFESARYITRASSLSPLYQNSNEDVNNHSPFYFRYHEGIALLDQIDPKKVAVSSNILLTSCEQYARCCLMEYEKRMRERCELYARASFVELNVIIPMTSQVASMQLSLDEKESNLRLVASRAGKAEQKLYETRIEFGETERKLREEIAQLKKQNEVLIRQGGNSSNNNGSNIIHTTPTKNNNNNSQNITSNNSANNNPPTQQLYLSAHQEDALARGKKLNLSRNELLQEEQQQFKDADDETGEDLQKQNNMTMMMVTPRTKSYHEKYLVKSDFSKQQDNNNNSSQQQQQQQQVIITPGAAERMMEQVKMQLADEYSSNLVQIHNMEEQIDDRIFGGLTNISVEMMNQGRRQQNHHQNSVSFASPEAVIHVKNVNNMRRNNSNVTTTSGSESPLQKLARMSSPITPSSAMAQQKLLELQNHSASSSSPIPKQTKSSQLRMNVNNNSSINNSSISVRSPRKEPFSTTISNNKNKAISPASSSSSPLSPSLSRDPTNAVSNSNNNAKNNNNNFREPQSIKMLDLANERINQQIETAKSSFLAMKEKYGGGVVVEGSSSSTQQQQHLVSTPRGSSLGTYPTSILKNQQPQSTATTTKDALAVPSSSYSYLNQKKAHFSSETATIEDEDRKRKNDSSRSNIHNSSSSSSSSSPSSRQRLILLEQLVLEQRSELSTLKAHLKGIEAQEAEVTKKRETVAASLRQAQSRIDFVSEEELRETNDRLTLVWEKIEEATNRLRQNRREVLSKMELMSRTLRNSEKEWNNARTELTKNGILV